MPFNSLHEFLIAENLIYLNHAGVSPLPRRTVETIEHFVVESMRYGAKNYAQWEQKETQLREQLRILLNAPAATDIALLKNTSEALSVVAYGLTWQAGDNIVIPQQEFPSNRIVWESLQNQGVIVRQVDISATPDPETALFAAVDERTRLIAVSSVQYATGLRMDLVRVGHFCREYDILFCVDAIQSLGALRFNVQAIHADFVMADGHKWLLAPEGLAVFYCKAERREQLRLHQFGWHMVENPYNFESKTWNIATHARRFECGSPNMLGIHALSASLSLLAEIGIEQVEARLLHNTDYILESLKRFPEIEILSPTQLHRRSGIVTFRHRSLPSSQLFKQLSQRGIVCAQRGGGIRFSPHFYINQHQLYQAIVWLAESLASSLDY